MRAWPGRSSSVVRRAARSAREPSRVPVRPRIASGGVSPGSACPGPPVPRTVQELLQPPSRGRLSGPDASAPCLYWRETTSQKAHHHEVSPEGTPRPVDEKELRPRHQRPAARSAVAVQLRRQQRRHSDLRHRGGRQVQARPERAGAQLARRGSLPGRVSRRGVAGRGSAAARRGAPERRLHPPDHPRVPGRSGPDGQPHPRGRARHQGARPRDADDVHHQGHVAPHPRRRHRPHRPGLRRAAGGDLRSSTPGTPSSSSPARRWTRCTGQAPR